MTITLELSQEMQAVLRMNIARQDNIGIRQLLADVFAPTVETLLQKTPVYTHEMSEEEFETLADQLAEEFTASIKPGTPPLSNYAVSRAGIYEEHP